MPVDRREFLKKTGLIALGPSWPALPPAESGAWVNDIHSQLNRTHVAAGVAPRSVEEVQRTVEAARRAGRAVSISGSRHAMGGQQFGTETTLLDLRGLRRIGGLDSAKGTLEVEAGAEWPEIIAHHVQLQGRDAKAWGIAPKQTGADRLTLGGALAANAHGRGLRMKPFISDVEAFTLVDASGRRRRCRREENADLFRLVIGGYGLFGVVTSVSLRLAPRAKLERVVEVGLTDDLMPKVEKHIAEGFQYRDIQFANDPDSHDFLRKGVFARYSPVDPGAPMAEAVRELSAEDWRELLRLAHTDRSRAFDLYASYYLSTSGQRYWSDTHQLSVYLEDYHSALDRALGAAHRATEMITEIYVPRPALTSLLAEARASLRKSGVGVTYGTIRLIEKDDECFLAWARERYACIIFNLHTVHTAEGLARSADAFRRLIDMAVARGGRYYLTYHRWARREQVLACHPQLPELLRLKKVHDSEELFQSEWYRHYKAMFA